jgi:phosphoribosylformylglycinamidine synthase
MINEVRRLFVEKKSEFAVDAENLLKDLKGNLGINSLESIRIVNRYDMLGLLDQEYAKSKYTIFSEKTVDFVYEDTLIISSEERVFAVEYLPGQYDQRADSASQCIQILTSGDRKQVRTARVYILKGNISDEEFEVIKQYCINSVDSREASLNKIEEFSIEKEIHSEVEIFQGFIKYSDDELKLFMDKISPAMSFEDLKFTRDYFKSSENRDPSITEIKVIDTYWSDHCRHTTFMTEIDNVSIKRGKFSVPIEKAYEEYNSSREYVYGGAKRAITLMDMAIIGMKELRKKGLLQDLDVSDEINACSIEIDADIDGKKEKWLVMFKNETHNHPTEIEPFGGAATCLGGAIRDPLSGRTYVYQAMRVTGSGDPRKRICDTLQGKLPQRKITIGAAEGYSSYGNQIGLSTGQVSEIYHEGFVAKRMEVGAVIAAAPKGNVVREVPVPGDVVILIGGRTGRDGCGGATGSSKEHTEESIYTSGAEVQKGNPPTERKIQRLFRNPKVTTLIKRCNDFGAGGVAVAIGELTEGLIINLDLVPKKYEGLDGTELAISESQERMAVVIARENVEHFINLVWEENLEATEVAIVTAEERLKMMWKGKAIVDINREFLNTNGVRQHSDVVIEAPIDTDNYFNKFNENVLNNQGSLKNDWLANLQNLNVCSQKGLSERFDNTIGSGTILMPFGGKYQLTPAEGMAAKLPVMSGETNTGTIMTYGYNPNLSKWSPFHGAMYAVVEAVTKVATMGGDYSKIRLTFQEYFEKLGSDPVKWGKPFSSLLGALYAEKKFGIPAIGGKDSMSGSFKDLDVPPTLVAFAVNVTEAGKVISPEFKKANSLVVLLKAPREKNEIPIFETLIKNYSKVSELNELGYVLAAQSIKSGGVSEAISKMAFGNNIGMTFNNRIDEKSLFTPDYGSIILELNETVNLDGVFEGMSYTLLGVTSNEAVININDEKISINEALKCWENPLESIFNTKTEEIIGSIDEIYFERKTRISPSISIAKPKIFIPVFPGTNCEYDSQRAFERAGGIVDAFVFKNLKIADIDKSIEQMVKYIKASQIIMIPGGFSAGDEPDGSGKFIATVFRNPRVKEAVREFLNKNDGLMLGICNGFQSLIKLGLLPYGDIREIGEKDPTLTYNKIGRHTSKMVQTKVVSTLSPWLSNASIGDIHTVPVSHGEGRFAGDSEEIKKLITKGQVATQYVDLQGEATYDIKYNPNGSYFAIEGVTSPDGRIFGKMAHSERIGANVLKNIQGEMDQKIFEAGVNYFK